MSQLHRIFVIALIMVAGFTPAAMAQTEKKTPNLTVLSIGVSQYKAPGNDLKHAAKDARDLAAAFKLHEGKLFGRVQTKTLTDAQATRQNIEEALDWLVKVVQPEEYVIVFVAGHGNIDALGHYYFVPHDYEPGRDRTAVRWTQFHDTLSRLPGTRFLIVDTCRSGGAGGQGAQVSQTDALKALSAHGFITYAACMSGEFSFEANGPGPIQNGYFTCALIEALSGKADVNGDGVITLAEVDAYVANRVKALSRGLQNPTMQRPWTIPSSLALALTYVPETTFATSMPLTSMPIAQMQPQTAPPTGPILPSPLRGRGVGGEGGPEVRNIGSNRTR